jgi:hypothetical protein
LQAPIGDVTSRSETLGSGFSQIQTKKTKTKKKRKKQKAKTKTKAVGRAAAI